jgi:hypothetical protein
MRNDEPEPEPEIEQLVERVERLEERMTQFEQSLRSFPTPSVETQGTDATAMPDTGDDAAHEDGNESAPEGA